MITPLNNQSGPIKSSILGAFIFGIVGGVFINGSITNSCEYHEPLSRQLTLPLSLFYRMSSGHLEVIHWTNWTGWILVGALFGFLVYKAFAGKTRNPTSNLLKKGK